MRGLALGRAWLVRDNDEYGSRATRIRRIASAAPGTSRTSSVTVAATLERPVARVPDELDDDAVAVEEDGARRSTAVGCLDRLPLAGRRHERGMRDEEVPHDRLELLDVRRAALGRRLDDDADVGRLARSSPSALPDDAEDACARPPARARSRGRGSPRRCARAIRRRPRRRGSRPARERREVRSHASKLVSQPSSFVRAVSSATLSVGAYASKSQSLRKSLTACDAWPAPPPTPRMNSRPPRSRTAASPFAIARCPRARCSPRSRRPRPDRRRRSSSGRNVSDGRRVLTACPCQ